MADFSLVVKTTDKPGGPRVTEYDWVVDFIMLDTKKFVKQMIVDLKDPYSVDVKRVALAYDLADAANKVKIKKAFQKVANSGKYNTVRNYAASMAPHLLT